MEEDSYRHGYFRFYTRVGTRKSFISVEHAEKMLYSHLYHDARPKLSTDYTFIPYGWTAKDQIVYKYNGNYVCCQSGACYKAYVVPSPSTVYNVSEKMAKSSCLRSNGGGTYLK